MRELIFMNMDQSLYIIFTFISITLVIEVWNFRQIKSLKMELESLKKLKLSPNEIVREEEKVIVEKSIEPAHSEVVTLGAKRLDFRKTPPLLEIPNNPTRPKSNESEIQGPKTNLWELEIICNDSKYEVVVEWSNNTQVFLIGESSKVEVFQLEKSIHPIHVKHKNPHISHEWKLNGFPWS
jgi:hypothetical protein